MPWRNGLENKGLLLARKRNVSRLGHKARRPLFRRQKSARLPAVRWLLIAVVVAAVVFPLGSIAGEWRTPWYAALNSARPELDDCRLAVLARQTLLDNRELARCNIGVSVHSNVATLWGRAPCAALKDLAERTVAKVAGIDHVDNDLLLDSEEEISVTAAGGFSYSGTWNPQQIQSPGHTLAESEPARQRGAPQSSELTGLPRHANRNGEVILLSPEPSTEQATPLRSPHALGTAALSSPAALSDAIARLQQNNPHWKQIVFSIKDGVVRINGSSDQQAAVFEFARAVAQLHSVLGVVVVNAGKTTVSR
jgi:hypothetical protein